MGRGSAVTDFNVEVSAAWKALTPDQRRHWESVAASKNAEAAASPEPDTDDPNAQELIARQ